MQSVPNSDFPGSGPEPTLDAGPVSRAGWFTLGPDLSRAFLFALVAATGAVLVISLPQLADPLVRVDDYPGVFGEEWHYYEKTLSEGRWLNYWWIARESMWAPAVTFAVYQAAWAVFAAAAAVTALGPSARRLETAVLAILIAFSPQAFLISGWFNTLALGMVFVAGVAVAQLCLPVGAGRWLFLIAAPVSMLSYSTYPLLLMGLVVTRHDTRRSAGGLVRLMALLAASIGLGMLLMYSINWFAHGVFGVEMGSWREPAPATDLASLLKNMETLPLFIQRLISSNGFGMTWLGVLNLALLAAALLVMARRRPGEAAYILAGIAASVGLLLVHSLKSGVEIPMRSLIVVWLLFSVACVRAASALELPRSRNGLVALLMIPAAIYASQILKNVRMSNVWQTETRELATRVPVDATSLVLSGDIFALNGAVQAGLLHPAALSHRLRLLTGLPVVDCGNPAVTCDGHTFADASPAGEVSIEAAGGTVFVRLPD